MDRSELIRQLIYLAGYNPNSLANVPLTVVEAAANIADMLTAR